MEMTSGDLFKAALRKCNGIIAEGETPSAELMEDTRETFNLMIDSWGLEKLMAFCSQDQILIWPANTVTRTIGPTGTLHALRPIKILDTSYFSEVGPFTDPFMDSDFFSDFKYFSEANPYINFREFPVVNATLIDIFMNFPDVTVSIFPVPTINLIFHCVSVLELLQVNDLVTTILCPPGYKRAMVYNLAVEMCAEFGMEPPPTVKYIAVKSKRAIKTSNAAQDILSLPLDFPGMQRRNFNINTGE